MTTQRMTTQRTTTQRTTTQRTTTQRTTTRRTKERLLLARPGQLDPGTNSLVITEKSDNEIRQSCVNWVWAIFR
jgi:hypothetical protein